MKRIMLYIDKVYRALRKKLPGLYFLLTPVLLLLSFPLCADFKFFPVIAHFALVPLFVKLRCGGFRKNIIVSFISGIFIFLFLNSWMKDFGEGAANGEAVILAALIPALAAQFALKAALSEKLASLSGRFRPAVFPAVWLLFDFLSTLGYIAFPWNFLGYSQYPAPFYIQIASIGGVYAVTFMVLISNITLSGLVTAQKKFIRKSRAGTAFAVLRFCLPFIVLNAAVISFGIYRTALTESATDERKFSFAVVQNCQSPWQGWSRYKMNFLRGQIFYSAKALNEAPESDMIIWSESATLETVSWQMRSGKVSDFTRALSQFVSIAGKYLLTGEIGREKADDGRILWYNSACLLDPSGKLTATHYKVHLAPVGEWFPYAKWFPSLKKYIDSMGGSDFTPGDGVSLMKAGSFSFGTAVCYESIFPEINRKYASLGADFAVVITNDGWSTSYQGHYHHFAPSVFRAVENGIWYVTSGNTGKTALINPFGVITAEIPILEKGFLNAEADFSLNRKTFYSEYGNVILYVYIISAILLLIFIASARQINRRGKTR